MRVKLKEKTQNFRGRNLNDSEDCPSLDLLRGINKRAWDNQSFFIEIFVVSMDRKEIRQSALLLYYSFSDLWSETH